MEAWRSRHGLIAVLTWMWSSARSERPVESPTKHTDWLRGCVLVEGRLRSLEGSTILGQGEFSVRHARELDWVALIFRWLTLGNQLGNDQIFEEDMAMRINERCAVLTAYLWLVLLTTSRKDIQTVGLTSLLSRTNETGRMRQRTSLCSISVIYGHSCMDMHNIFSFDLRCRTLFSF